VLGVPVEITPSWILLAILVLWSFWARYTTDFGHKADGIAIAMALVATVLFLGSVLAHELGHALVAKARGLRLSVVTLYIFGGATSTSDPRTPFDELVFTAIGPVVNLALAGALYGVTLLANRLSLPSVAQVSGEAAWLNLLLGAFNLLPASPLDGGRVVEAVAWRLTRDHARAIRAAASAGAALGSLLMGLGVAEFLLVAGGLIEGLWLGLIGYMLLEGSRAERYRAWIEEMLRGRPASVLLTDRALPVTADTSVGWLVNTELLRHHVDVVPVEDQGRTVGVVLAADALAVPPEKRFILSAADVMRSHEQVPAVPATADALEVLKLLADHDVVVLLDDYHRVLGAVSERQVDLVLERLRMSGALA
jgi:Zn-dependent protease